jgi:hypothetical protein
LVSSRLVSLLLHRAAQPRARARGQTAWSTLTDSADRSERRPAQPGEGEAERPNVSAAEFAIVGDDPLPRCGRPGAVTTAAQTRRSRRHHHHRSPRSPELHHRPEPEITKKESAPPPPATSPSNRAASCRCTGQADRAGRADQIASRRPASRARVRADSMVNAAFRIV